MSYKVTVMKVTRELKTKYKLKQLSKRKQIICKKDF